MCQSEKDLIHHKIRDSSLLNENESRKQPPVLSLFTESVPRPIQSLSSDVHVCVCQCFCPRLETALPDGLETLGQRFIGLYWFLGRQFLVSEFCFLGVEGEGVSANHSNVNSGGASITGLNI